MTAKDDLRIRDHWRCFLACGLIILSPFQYGIDFGLIGGLQAMPGFLKIFGHEAPDTAIGWNLSPVRQQLITSLMSLGAFISSGTAGFAAVKLGRKVCLYIACLGCIVSNVIMMTTTDINALYIGRLLNGLANGYFMTFSQLWIQESSPAKYRGLFLSVFQFSTSFGTLIGTIVDFGTSPRPDKSAYLIPLGIIYVMPFFLAVGMFFIPESPRWLILQGRVEEGRKALKWLRPTGVEIDVEFTEIQDAIARERELGSDVGIVDMFKNPIDRRRTFLSIAGITTQAASGSMFVISYKAYFFTMAKVSNPFAMSCVLSTVGLAALVANSLIIVRYGRRRVLMTNGLVICGVLQLIIAIVYDKNPVTAAWVYFFLPEVHGRTLEEIDEMFEAKLGARKFRGYKCVRRVTVEELSEKAQVKHEDL
ncbi:putative general alpha-glucoside permease protein [Eutypa lata UCREL1]|uniref:Putative general alpha-glucoside permease protein n=1 Tax=Eutypa lata (strain UCR-EL1) TaxID=1287681 RepID=M7TFJ8_EUTLA|nr:putative general alpha-glucoside permease protein [Eutypa lata UCREL1]